MIQLVKTRDGGELTLVVFTIESFDGGNNHTQYFAVFTPETNEEGKQHFSLIDVIPIAGKGWHGASKLNAKVTRNPKNNETLIAFDGLGVVDGDAPNFPSKKVTINVLLKAGRLVEQKVDSTASVLENEISQMQSLLSKKRQYSLTESVSKNGISQVSSVVENLYGEQWGLVLFLSFLFTWGLGLAPPLLIRLAIIRHPICKSWPLGLVFIFLVFNLVLFAELGIQSRTYSSLTLVAFASYEILRKCAK